MTDRTAWAKKARKPLKGGTVKGTRAKRAELPRSGKVKRYLLTSAQNNTSVHEQWWTNLLALAKHLRAELHVAPITYNRNSWRANEREDLRSKDDSRYVWYDPKVAKYLSRDRIQLAPKLVWCAEFDTCPTAEQPLSGLELYCGRNSAIIPHAKIAMESVASGKREGAKLLFTTGSATLRNYIKKKAGLKGEMHHRYGALLVEVREDGTWFCRQVEANEHGDAQDLDVAVSGGEVTTGNPVEAINWFDVHPIHLREDVVEMCWGPDGILDQLQPKFQFFHDVFDMYARNPHDRKNPLRMYQRFARRLDSVRDELKVSAALLMYSERPWCRSVVVKANHDDMLEKWVSHEDARQDPVNATFWWEAGRELWKAQDRGEHDWLLIEWALRREGAPKPVQFLKEDEQFIICRGDGAGGIECGMHGHNGPNGSRGKHHAFSKMGRRANTGHEHSAGIYNGLFVSGAGELDMLYNIGPSSWSKSLTLTYPIGTRAIVTIYDGGWRG